MQEAAFHRGLADFSLPLPHRFSVYRNNVASALIDALRVRFPVTEKLMGAQAFAALTQDFIAAHRPRSPVLVDYGDTYPEFIAARAALPYLADVARLESLWWRAYHAADVEPLAAERFALGPEILESARFVFHPSAGILTSRWAVGVIWEAARKNDPNEVEIERPQSVMVGRPHAGVRVNVIDGATAGFLAALMQGKRLFDAIGTGLELDLQAQFEMLIASQLVTAIETADRP